MPIICDFKGSRFKTQIDYCHMWEFHLEMITMIILHIFVCVISFRSFVFLRLIHK